ncbi:beta-ketoacyl synthase chain length factor [Streptomyces sp. NPDC002285]
MTVIGPSSDLAAQAATAGLTLLAHAGAPVAGQIPPALRGFPGSSFSATAAAAAAACLNEHRPPADSTGASRTAILLLSALGDVSTARNVATAVSRGERLSPQLFFLSVPNSVIGHIAAQWNLTGPVICTSPIGEPLAEGLELAAHLAEDGDADHFLLILINPVTQSGEPCKADAFLLTSDASCSSTERHR